MPTFASDLRDPLHEYAHQLSTATKAGSAISVLHLLNSWPHQPTKNLNSAHKIPELWPYKLVLEEAIKTANADLASLVLQSGLKVELYAAFLALNERSEAIFEVLINYGWDINMPLGDTLSPCLAYILTDEPLTHWFLAHGASPTATASALYMTPLMQACTISPLHIVKLLHAHSTSMHNALQCAAGADTENRLEVMAFLLDNGAEIDAVKWKHHLFSYQSFEWAYLGSALHYAVTRGFEDRVKLLLGRGADIKVLNSAGQDVKETAKASGNLDILELPDSHIIDK